MKEWCKNRQRIAVECKTEGFDHKNLQVTAIKYLSDHRKHRYELVDKPKKQSNRTLICKELAAKAIIDCRTTATCKFRTRLGCKQNDVILTKEQSVYKNKELI